MATTRKQIVFDLDTNALQRYYPTENWRNAYEIIKRHMRVNDFEWQQGSVYVSEKPLPAREVSQIIKILVKDNPWINTCMRDCTVTSIE